VGTWLLEICEVCVNRVATGEVGEEKILVQLKNDHSMLLDIEI
jgi:hypothetical protein